MLFKRDDMARVGAMYYGNGAITSQFGAITLGNGAMTSPFSAMNLTMATSYVRIFSFYLIHPLFPIDVL